MHPLRCGELALIRYIGHPPPELNETLLDEWVARVAHWLAEGTDVYFFCHCPNERRSPALCRAFQRRLERLADVPPLPSIWFSTRCAASERAKAKEDNL